MTASQSFSSSHRQVSPQFSSRGCCEVRGYERSTLARQTVTNLKSGRLFGRFAYFVRVASSKDFGSSELSVGVGWGLRVEVEVLDDERTSTPAIFKDLDNVPPYLLLLCVA